MEKKVIKTKKELEMEKAEKEKTQMEGEEIPVEKVEKIETEPETEKSEWEMRAEKGRNTAQKFIDDMVSTFRERGGDVEKALSEYSFTPSKLNMDVMETDDSIIVKADLPGVKKEDITIDLTEDSIEIIAKFEEEKEETGKNFVKKERRYGEATRSLILPDVIKVKEASAKFDNGVLTVILPKLEAKKKFSVKVD